MKSLERIITEAIENFLENDSVASCASYIFCRNEEGKWCILGGRRGSTAPSCPNMYNVPTGMREMDETPQECARRECQEETNISIPMERFRYIDKQEWAKGKFGANFLVVLDGTVGNYRIGNGDGENDRFKWIPMDMLWSVQWAWNMDSTIVDMFRKIGGMNK